MRAPLLLLMSLATLSAAPLRLYLGTYTNNGQSRGIYTVQLDPATGALGAPSVAAETRNPTFLDISPDGRWLYATGALSTAGERTGGISVFAREAASGALELVCQQAVPGGPPCHLVASADRRVVLSANYNEGFVCAFPLAPDGHLAGRSACRQHDGPTGPMTARQNRAHAHSVTLSPDQRFAYACDLGLDRIYIYALAAAPQTLTPAATPFVPAPAGAGPRHAKFSTDGRFLYVVNELAGSVSVYACDPATGALALQQTLSCLPDGFAGENTSGEIRLHPNGRFVYVSNRGPDSLAVFQRQPTTGALTLVEIVPCGGRHPRNFALSPDGRWLVCANRDTDNLTVFAVDAATGRLAATPATATIPQVVCVLFAP